jgi:hypothetical protein
MRFWIREAAGWVLVLLGLYVFYLTFSVLLTPGPLLIEAIYLTVIGVVVFRAGIHLLKVAVAARVCLHAQARLQQEEPRRAAARRSPSGRAPGRATPAEFRPS